MSQLKHATLILGVLIWASNAFSLDPKIEGLLERQSEELHKLLDPASKQQKELLLHRYAELLSTSLFTLNIKVDKEELEDRLQALFPKDGQRLAPKERKHKFAKSVEESIAILGRAFSGRFKGDALELKFSCGEREYTFPFEISQRQNDFTLAIKGVHIPDSDDDWEDEDNCFELIIENNGSSALLNSVSTQETACPLPRQRAGECLLSVAERLAKALALPVISLNDGSRVRCSATRTYASLSRLKIYQEGMTWYEKNGYQSQSNTYAQSKKALLGYPLPRLLSDLEEHAADKDSRYIAEMARLFEQNKEQGDKVADFMSWLWDKDCAAYIRIDEYITRSAPKLDFAKLWYINTRFEKKLTK
jgi:hypothetical protein